MQSAPFPDEPYHAGSRVGAPRARPKRPSDGSAAFPLQSILMPSRKPKSTSVVPLSFMKASAGTALPSITAYDSNSSSTNSSQARRTPVSQTEGEECPYDLDFPFLQEAPAAAHPLSTDSDKSGKALALPKDAADGSPAELKRKSKRRRQLCRNGNVTALAADPEFQSRFPFLAGGRFYNNHVGPFDALDDEDLAY